MRLPTVDLIQEPSRGRVLSNVGAGADGVTGDLAILLEGDVDSDRIDTAAFASLRRDRTTAASGAR